MIAFLWFAGAVVFITIAHFLRVVRWELFISVYEKPNRRQLLKAISWGYLLNYFLPFKLGDLVRAHIAGRNMKSGRALGYSTVIVDRFLDIICVGFIFLVLALNKIGGSVSFEMASAYIAIAVVLLVLAVIVFSFRLYFKKIVKAVAQIFNHKIESYILQFSWAIIWNFKDIANKISKRKLIVHTIEIWGFYLLSYYMFARFLSFVGSLTSWFDVFIMLFTQNGLKESTGSIVVGSNILNGYALYLSVYMIVPLVFIMILSWAYPNVVDNMENGEGYLNLLPHLDAEDKLLFLENYFSNNNHEYISNYLKINQGISIIRDMSAGSNATTLLCMDGKNTFYRKYAFGKDADKLYEQILWIKDNENKLPLPKIIRYDKSDSYCFYDMAYSANTVGLFEYVHSVPSDKAFAMIEKVLDSLETSIHAIDVKKADVDTIERYIDEKVVANLQKIKNAKVLKKILQYPSLIINGVECKNLDYYSKYLEKDFLKEIFARDSYSIVHGDLTIENVICTRDEQGKDDFYIIDPNTGNVHDSPLLDYAKLLQSLHGGYEFLMATNDVKVTDNQINFLFTKSSTYIELHNRLKEYLSEHFTKEEIISIYFHEIINWLRLMPYKIDNDENRAVLFYTGTLLVIKDVIEMYADEE